LDVCFIVEFGMVGKSDENGGARIVEPRNKGSCKSSVWIVRITSSRVSTDVRNMK
jgi:hypothetical protein